MYKQYYHDIDLVKNSILNAKFNPLSTSQRTTLGGTLTTSDKGIVVYDINDFHLYSWNGTSWDKCLTLVDAGNFIDNQDTIYQPASFKITGTGTIDVTGWPTTDEGLTVINHSAGFDGVKVVIGADQINMYADYGGSQLFQINNFGGLPIINANSLQITNYAGTDFLGHYTALVFQNPTITANVTIKNQAGTLALLSDIPTSLPTTNSITFNNSGSGAVSGTTFNGSIAKTISYNSIGAQVALVSGTNIKTVNSTSILGSGDIPFPTTLPPSGSAGGDLSGTYPNPTVNTINSITKAYYDPTSSIQTQLNSKLAVSVALSTYMPFSGGTFTGDVQQPNAPTNANSLVNQGFVLAYINGQNWKHSVKATTTGNLPSYTVSGDFLTLTATANGALPAQDGVTLIVSDYLLVKNETGGNKVNHGSYIVTQVGDISNPYILTRAPDSNTSLYLLVATYKVREGSTQAFQVYTVNVDPITLGTTQITFALTGGPGTYLNGTGILLSGNIFSIDPSYTATSGRTGYLSSTDWSAFDTKEPAITSGTTAQYWRGDKSFQNLNAAVISSVLTSYTSGVGTISSSDSILTAIQKLNGNIAAIPTDYITSDTAQTGLTGAKTTGGIWTFSNGIVAGSGQIGTKFVSVKTTAAGVGLVGYQNTSNTGYTSFDLYDDATVLQMSFGHANSGTSGTVLPSNNYINSNSSVPLLFLANTVEVFRYTPTAISVVPGATLNIGATSNPTSEPFYLTANITSGIARLQNTNNAGYVGVDYYDNSSVKQLAMGYRNPGTTSGTISYFDAVAGNPIVWLSSSVEKMRLTSTGLGLLSSVPTHTLTLGSASTGIAYYNTSDQVTNYERIKQYWNSNAYTFSSEGGGTGSFRDIAFSFNGGIIYNISNAGTNGAFVSVIRNTGGTTPGFGIASTYSASTAVIQNGLAIYPTINQNTGVAAGYRGLWISPFEQAVGTGNKYLIDAGINSASNLTGTHTSKFTVDNTGKVNSSSLNASTVLVSDASKNIISSTTTATQVGYLSTTTSDIQTQMNGKEPSITVGTSLQYWRGDKTFQTLNTTIVPEGTGLYYTNARTIASTLTGYTSGAGTILATDTILSAIQKLNGNATTLYVPYTGATTGVDLNVKNLTNAGQIQAVSVVQSSVGTTSVTIIGNGGATRPTVGQTTNYGGMSIQNSGGINHIWSATLSSTNQLLYSSSASHIFYANGTTQSLSITSTGVTIPTLTANSVLFAGTGGLISQDNSNFYYDSSTHKLSVSVAGDFTGSDSINIYGQYDAYQPQSSIGTVTSSGTTPGYTASTSRGTGASPIINNTGDLIGSHSYWAYTGSTPAYTYMAGMVGTAIGATSANLGGQLDFYVKADGGSASSAVTILNDNTLRANGYLLIGQSNTSSATPRQLIMGEFATTGNSRPAWLFQSPTNYIGIGQADETAGTTHMRIGAITGTKANWGTFGGLTFSLFIDGVVGIGTQSVVASSMLTLASTTRGSIPMPSMTTIQRTAISSPAEAVWVYDATLHNPFVYNGSAWASPVLSTGGSMTGQLNINNSAIALLGATPATDPSIYITSAGIKIGTTGNLTHNYTGYNNGTITTDTGASVFILNIPTGINGTLALTSQLPIHGNSTTTGAATTVVTVTIGTTQANNTYFVNITPKDLLTAVNWYVSAQTTTTFDITFATAITGSINFDWSVTP